MRKNEDKWGQNSRIKWGQNSRINRDKIPV